MSSFLAESFLYDRYKNVQELIGDKEIEEPSIIKFKNADEACEMLKEAINGHVDIRLHGDVDVDGIGTTKVLYTFIKTLNPQHNVKLCINKDKVHGVSESHIKYFNNQDKCLVVILDSGTNDIEYIKQIKHDVLVIDHHDVLVTELNGKTAGGKYCIVNNMLDSDTYKANKNMSACLVVYELLRYMQDRYKLTNILEDKMLYDWVVVTLFTDVVDTDELRNLYYIEKAFGSSHVEPGLRELMDRLYNYGKGIRPLDKSFISYTLAPVFNRAIRAGKSSTALNTAILTPQKVGDLTGLKEYEGNLLSNYLDGSIDMEVYVKKDITDGIGKSYCGLVATKLLDHYRKSAICYIRVGEQFEGSFRGCYQDIDYRKMVEDLGYFAQGHGPAFGFKVPINDLSRMMSRIADVEIHKDHKEYLTAGNIEPSHQGKYHLTLEDVKDFKRQGYAWKIGFLNSRISNSSACINIVVSCKDLKITEVFDKRIEYECLGFKGCIAFEQIVSEYAYLYIEFNTELKFYLRNKWK